MPSQEFTYKHSSDILSNLKPYLVSNYTESDDFKVKR